MNGSRLVRRSATTRGVAPSARGSDAATAVAVSAAMAASASAWSVTTPRDSKAVSSTAKSVIPSAATPIA